MVLWQSKLWWTLQLQIRLKEWSESPRLFFLQQTATITMTSMTTKTAITDPAITPALFPSLDRFPDSRCPVKQLNLNESNKWLVYIWNKKCHITRFERSRLFYIYIYILSSIYFVQFNHSTNLINSHPQSACNYRIIYK